jgi:hypothetical protein
MKTLVAIVLAVLLLTGCGEVSWQRKYVVPIHVHQCDSEGSIAVVNIEIPVDMKKAPDTKPNVPIDVSIPLIPKGMSGEQGFVLPQDTGNLIIIWSAKKTKPPEVQEVK